MRTRTLERGRLGRPSGPDGAVIRGGYRLNVQIFPGSPNLFLPMFPVRPYPGAISVSGASITGSIAAVTFHTDIAPPERGEHWTQGQFVTQAALPQVEPPARQDPVQAGTDVALVVVFFAVTGWSLVAVWANGRWVASFRSGSSA